MGIRQSYQQAAQGRVAVYFGSNCAAPLTRFQTRVGVPDAIGGTAPALRVQLQPLAASSLEPAASLTQQLLVQCMRPFGAMPTLTVSFEAQGRLHVFELPLPVALSSFILPAPLEAAPFAKHWGRFSSEGLGQSHTLVVAAAVDEQKLVQVLKQARLAGMPLGEGRAVGGCGTFRTASVTAAGAKISIECMALLQLTAHAAPDCQTLQLTVRAAHKDTTHELARLLVQSLQGALQPAPRNQL